MKRVSTLLLVCLLCLAGAATANAATRKFVPGEAYLQSYGLCMFYPEEVDLSRMLDFEIGVSSSSEEGMEQIAALNQRQYIYAAIQEIGSGEPVAAGKVSINSLSFDYPRIPIVIEHKNLRRVKAGEYDIYFYLMDSTETNVIESTFSTITFTEKWVSFGYEDEEEPNGFTQNAFKNVKVGMEGNTGVAITGDLEVMNGSEANIVITIHQTEDANGNDDLNYINVISLLDQKSGPFSYTWNLLGADGDRVPNGKYKLKITAEDDDSNFFYGNTFTVTLNDPVKIGSAAMTAETYWLDYSGYPTLTITAATGGSVTVKVLDPAGKAVRTITKDVKKNAKTDIAWDYKNDAGAYVKDGGNYTFEITTKNGGSASEAIKKTFTVKKRPALTLEAAGNRSKCTANAWERIIFTGTANQGCNFKLEILSADGKAVETFKREEKKKDALLHLCPRYDDGSYYKPGNYSLRITATTMLGESKTASVKFIVTEAAKVSISNEKLSKTSLYAGDALTFTAKTSTKSNIYLYVTNAKGAQVKHMVAPEASDGGKQSITIDTSGLAAGRYTVVFTAETGKNKATAKKNFTIKN